MKTDNICKTCKHWKNNQAELSYWDSTGFCTNDKFRFNTNDGRLIGVIDRKNPRDRIAVSGNCSNDFETVSDYPRRVQPSNYALVTEEKFGCIFHKK